jgi:hypothetical protein
MRKMLLIGAVCFIALIVWTGLAFAQTAKPAAMKTVKLPNGQEVFDISGEWDVLVENYGEWAQFGTYPQLVQVTIRESDSSFHGIRLMDNPQPGRKAGSFLMAGELDKNGITRLELPVGEKIPDTWKISENGNKINVDVPNKSKVTLTRK